MLHLVEWKTPGVVGTAGDSHALVGWNRIAHFMRSSADARAAVIAQGTEPLFQTHDRPQPGSAAVYDSFVVRDPDGVFNQFFGGGLGLGGGPGQPVRSPIVWNHNTADLDRYASFFFELLGLDLVIGASTPEPIVNIYGPAGGRLGMTEPS